MMEKMRKLYSSANGDHWHLVLEPPDEVFVRHEANAAAGGTITHIDIATFLSFGRGPEQQELLRLIGTLIPELAPERDAAS